MPTKKIALTDGLIASMKSNVTDWKTRINNIRKAYREGKRYLKDGKGTTRLWLQCCRAELPIFFKNGKEAEWLAFVDKTKGEVSGLQTS